MIKHVQTQEARAQRVHSGVGTEDRFRAIVELAPDATVVTDRQGRITLVNRQTEALFGYERADMLGELVEVLIPTRFHAAHQRHRAQYAAAPGTRPMGANLQLFGQRRDGGEFPVEVSLSPLGDTGGLSVICTIRDVSERQRTEAARAAAEMVGEELRRLQAISDVALTHPNLDELLPAVLTGIRTVMAVDNVAILLTSEDGQALTLHAAQGPEEESLASQVSVPIGRGVAGHIAATRRPLVVDDLSTVEVINPLLRKHLQALVGVPLLVGDRLIGVVHVASASSRHFTDIDAHLLQLAAERIAHALDHARMYDAEQAARKEAEAALARAQVSERRYQRLMEANIIGIVIGDTERILEANDAYLRLLGYTREDLVAGRLSRVALTPPEYLAGQQCAIEQALAAGACDPFYKEYVRQDGSRVPALVGLALLERDPARFVSFVLDLTEEKRLEQERQAAHVSEEAAHEATRRMERFVATAAHDLRTPLTATVGYLDLAQHKIEQLAARVRETHPDLAPNVSVVHDRVEVASQSADRLKRLLGLLFDTAAIRAGRLELHRAPIDLAALVREQVAALRVAAPERTILLRTPAHGRPVLVEVDADRIGEVVTNLVSNALKYSPLERPVYVSVEARRDCARLAVRDAGIGIPQAEQAHVWELFHRAAGVVPQGDTKTGSLGLGLYTSKLIIEAHSGQVGVMSAVGTGSTFWFTLPLAGLAGTIGRYGRVVTICRRR